MRQAQHGRKPRGRGRKQHNPLSRIYDSSGPDAKIRGTAAHIAEKYQTLSRDATSSGDRVAAENYLQHAEHYLRILATAQAAQAPNPDQQNANDQNNQGRRDSSDDDDDGNSDDNQPRQQSRNQDSGPQDGQDGDGQRGQGRNRRGPRRRNAYEPGEANADARSNSSGDAGNDNQGNSGQGNSGGDREPSQRNEASHENGASRDEGGEVTAEAPKRRTRRKPKPAEDADDSGGQSEKGTVDAV